MPRTRVTSGLAVLAASLFALTACSDGDAGQAAQQAGITPTISGSPATPTGPTPTPSSGAPLPPSGSPTAGVTGTATGAADLPTVSPPASPPPTTRSAPAATPSPPGTAGSGFSRQDRAFLVQAHRSNLAEIQAGRDAQRKATSAAVRSAGRRFVEDHTTLDASIRQLAAAAGVALPDEPSPAQQQSLARVAARRGIAYDRAWIDQQMASHETTLADINREIANGQAPGVVAAARAAKPVVQGHMDLLDTAEADLVEPDTSGPPSGVDAGTGGQAAIGDNPLGAALVGLGLACLTAAGVVAMRRRRV